MCISGDDPVHKTDQIAASYHTNVVCENYILCAYQLGKVHQVTFPVAVIDLVNGAVVVHILGHHRIAEGLLDDDGHRTVGDIGVCKFRKGLITGGKYQILGAGF